MENSACNAEAICGVLRRHDSTLRRVRLEWIYLLDHGSWELVFDALGEFSWLEHLRIGTLKGRDEDHHLCDMMFPDLSLLRQMAANDDEADTMDASDDVQENEAERDDLIATIELHGNQIATLLPTLTRHLIYKRSVD